MRARPIVPAVLIAALGGACSDSAGPELSDLDLMRQGTERYQNIQTAVADGFVPLSPCVAAPPGGMGYHYGHPARLETPTADPSSPEILLYEPTAGGGMTLVGVEFMVHRDAWYGAGNSAPPAVAGRSYDPPDPNHPDEHLRDFYTLHVWAWKDNPAGMFSPFNPTVSCGPGAGSHGHHH